MELGDLVTRDSVFASLPASNKKQALQELAARASALTKLDQREIFDALQQRESLGSTGFGRGVAIPHVRLRNLTHTICLFARLESAVDFDALDGELVDLVFLLLSPEHASGDHLKTLARISRLVREPDTIERLRSAPDSDAIHAILGADTAVQPV
jgi:nitrogen PTS system EIIA component